MKVLQTHPEVLLQFRIAELHMPLTSAWITKAPGSKLNIVEFCHVIHLNLKYSKVSSILMLEMKFHQFFMHSRSCTIFYALTNIIRDA